MQAGISIDLLHSVVRWQVAIARLQGEGGRKRGPFALVSPGGVGVLSGLCCSSRPEGARRDPMARMTLGGEGVRHLARGAAAGPSQPTPSSPSAPCVMATVR